MARWILALSSVANDLLTVNSLIVQSFDINIDGSEELKEMGKRMYYFKLACSHFNEAMKIIIRGEKIQPVIDFLNEVSIENNEAYNTIVHCKDSWDTDTFLGKVVKPVRNSTFHYQYDNELADALQAIYSDAPDFRSCMISGLFKDSRYIFADEVFAYRFQQMLNGIEMTTQEAMQHLSGLITSMVTYTDEIVSAYIVKKTTAI